MKQKLCFEIFKILDEFQNDDQTNNSSKVDLYLFRSNYSIEFEIFFVFARLEAQKLEIIQKAKDHAIAERERSDINVQFHIIFSMLLDRLKFY